MAIHTGEAEERDGDYFGAAVNRCARLRAIGHGGQILLSHATYDLVRDQPPAGVVLYDLGEHRLRDLVRPEHIFQVVTLGLPAEFPPLRTLDALPHNLPLQPTVLIGREREVEAVRRLLLQPETRLLTLTGPGGTGKTRLALQIGAESLEDFADGVFFVPLAPIADPNLVATTIAQTLGVREREGSGVQEALTAHLRDKAMLLVLDNFEQVIDAAPVVTGLLVACPRLKVLVTSRIILHLRGEREFPVPPLAAPAARPSAGGSRQSETRDAPDARLPTADSLRQYAAVQLFIERALDVRPDFAVTNENAPAVAEICTRLDGLPLAIELAAARIRLLPPQAMLARMERRLPLLVGGARDLPARQQTLHGAIAWSHDLLTADEQTLFRRLAVFSGGCTLEDAEAVCDLTPQPPSLEGGPSERQRREVGWDLLGGLESLVAQSLLRQEDVDGDARFSMFETIREYALEQLAESGEAEAVHEQHAAVFLALARRAHDGLQTPRQGAWLAHLETEHDNLRAAFGWLEARADVERVVQMVETLHRFWQMHGHLTEGRELTARAVALAATAGQREAQARALNVGGGLAVHQSDFAAARRLYEQALALLRASAATTSLREILIYLGSTATKQGDYDAARAYIEEGLAVARQVGDTFVIAQTLNDLANLAHEQGDYADALAHYGEGLTLARQLGSPFIVATLLNNMAVVAQDQGDTEAARGFIEECLAVRRQMGDRRGTALALVNLANLLTTMRDYDGAHALLAESLTTQQELGDPGGIAFVLERFAGLAAARTQPQRALRLAGAAGALREAVGAVAQPDAHRLLDERLASARLALGEPAAAAVLAEGRAMPLDEAVAEALAGS